MGKSSIYGGFSIGMFDYWRVFQSFHLDLNCMFGVPLEHFRRCDVNGFHERPATSSEILDGEPEREQLSAEI